MEDGTAFTAVQGSDVPAIDAIRQPSGSVQARLRLAGTAAELVAISNRPQASEPVIYLSVDGPADYRIFVQSKSFSVRDAAALIVGAQDPVVGTGHHRLEAASL